MVEEGRRLAHGDAVADLEPPHRPDPLRARTSSILAASSEPLTVSKIRAQLPPTLRTGSVEELGEILKRQAAASVLVPYPKYRSQQDRYWDRPLPVHIAVLVQEALQEQDLGLSELRRKMPSYAVTQLDTVLREQINQGKVYRHPRPGKRGGDLFSLRPPDPKDYLRTELAALFLRLEKLGFTQEQLREGALELLHEEEWASTISQARESATAQPPLETAAAAAPAQGKAAPAVPAGATDLNGLISEAARDLADYQRLTAEGKLGEAGQKLEALKRALDQLDKRAR